MSVIAKRLSVRVVSSLITQDSFVVAKLVELQTFVAIFIGYHVRECCAANIIWPDWCGDKFLMMLEVFDIAVVV